MSRERNSLSRGYEIDLRDLMARLVRRWYVVLIVLLIGAFLGGALAVLSARSQSSDVSLQDRADAAGEALTPQQREHVAFLHSEYVSLREYRNSLENYLTGSLYSEDELENSVILTAMYYIDSAVENANQVLRILSLNGEDYEKLAQILGADAADMDDVYRRIRVTEVPERSRVQQDVVTADGKNNVLVTKETATPLGDHLLQVWVIADSGEQAEQMLQVAEDAFDRSLEGLRDVDPDAKITSLGRNESANVADVIVEREADIVARMKEVEEQLEYLKKEGIDELSDAEEAYYDALDALESADPKAEGVSSGWKKKALIGRNIGLIIGCVLVILGYLLDGRVKTARELKDRYDVDVPYVVYKKHRPGNPLGGASRLIARVGRVNEAVVRSMAASDIVFQLQKTGITSLSLVCDRVTIPEGMLADALQQELNQKDAALEIVACDPCASVEELEKFSETKGVILVAQMKKTRSSTVEQWIRMCDRYDIPVVSVIALKEC